MALNKHNNNYNQLIDGKLYERTPKAVFAAIVVSEYINRLGLEPHELDEAILAEWKILHQNGIVPQNPPNNVL